MLYFLNVCVVYKRQEKVAVTVCVCVRMRVRACECEREKLSNIAF